MKSFSILPVFGLAAAVNAFGSYSNDTTVTTTEVVATLTTFCPEATTLTTNGKTYTATKSETLTITDCPCTVQHTAAPTPSVVVPPVIPVPVGNATITSVLTAYTTYCPAATSIVQGNQTYTVSEATTLTITNCPCTVSYPATTVSTSTLSVITTYCPTPTVIPVPVGNSTSSYTVTASGTVTIPVLTTTPVPASPPTPSAPGSAPTTGAAGVPGVPSAGVPSGAASGTAVPPAPSASASSTSPVTASSGDKATFGLGALVAGALAMFL